MLTFGNIKLVPGTYQVCEFIMPGWDSTIRTAAEAFVPNSLADPANTDNAYVCVPFEVGIGETKVLSFNNTPPPGGMAKTIGFWKNWTSCDGHGNQDPVLDETLVAAGSIFIGDLELTGTSCEDAVSILDKRDTNNGKKKAKDAAYNLAAQLLAAKLNLSAGAETCQAVVDAVNAGQALLAGIGFDGSGKYLRPKDGQIYRDALELASILDEYNNGNLCTP